ncbi:MAG: polyphenol oxidase family protein [Patescibacteria group bacterium]|nr:polyphenol oxidase family protein [Patescibacteria group bacterium]
MVNISPFDNLEVLISQKSDGNLNKEKKAKSFLKTQCTYPLCYFHHLHQAQRHFYQNKDDVAPIWSDAVISKDKNICVAMSVADCFPVILFEPSKQIFALIHGGWRPLLLNILELTIQDLKYQSNINPNKLKAWIGPGIRSCCYFFKDKPMQADLLQWQPSIKHTQKGWQVDLPEFIKTELQRLGIESSNIKDQEICTHCDQNLFSYFGSKGEKSGKRFVVAAYLE